MSQQFNYASFLERLIAFVIDNFVFSILLYPFLVIFVKDHQQIMDNMMIAAQTGAPIEVSLPFILVEIVLPIVVILLFWFNYGATPGKMLFKLKIVDAKTGLAASKGQLIIRYFGYILSILPMGLGFFWIIVDPKKQAWHDKIAKTVVIRTQPMKGKNQNRRSPQAISKQSDDDTFQA